ncbi:MAG: peptidoglycan editing factor PgeF [Bauldia sp.]|nr:peptidoglycan editing factor PgeF [Bauldia sp.]
MLTPDTLGAESITAPTLASLPGIRHGFFTRRGGVSAGLYASLNCGVGSGDARPLVLNNRARVASSLRVRRERLLSPYQVHGAAVAIATEPWEPGKGPEADGIVTKERGLAVGVGTADCAPVLFADAEGGVVGAAHAGWGGAFKGVLEATLDRMLELGAKKTRIVAVIGPTIAQASYEVGPEFVQRFLAVDLNNARYFRPSAKEGHAMFDLPAYAAGRLERLGLASVAGLGLDTYADEERFFSFRRSTHRGEKEYGRMISAIALA